MVTVLIIWFLHLIISYDLVNDRIGESDVFKFSHNLEWDIVYTFLFLVLFLVSVLDDLKFCNGGSRFVSLGWQGRVWVDELDIGDY